MLLEIFCLFFSWILTYAHSSHICHLPFYDKCRNSQSNFFQNTIGISRRYSTRMSCIDNDCFVDFLLVFCVSVFAGIKDHNYVFVFPTFQSLLDLRQNIYKIDAFSFTSSVLKLLTVVSAYFLFICFSKSKNIHFQKVKRETN